MTTGVRSARCQQLRSSRIDRRTRCFLAPPQQLSSVRSSRTVTRQSRASGRLFTQDTAADTVPRVSCSSADRAGTRAAMTSPDTSTLRGPGSSSDRCRHGSTNRATRPGTASSHSGTQALRSRQAAAVLSLLPRAASPASCADTLSRGEADTASR